MELLKNYGGRADILPGLCDDRPHIAAVVDTRKLAHVDGGAVHDDRGDRLHAGCAFAARFALYQPCKQFSGIQCHIHLPSAHRLNLYYAGRPADVQENFCPYYSHEKARDDLP